MEKRALLAIALSIGVIVAWQFFFITPQQSPPSAPASEVAGQGQPPAAEGTKPPSSTGSDSGALAKTAASQAPSPTPQAEMPLTQAAERIEFRLITSAQDLRLTNEGGRVLQWRLTKFTRKDDVAVDLIPDKARTAGVLPLQLEIPGEAELNRKLATAFHVHQIEEIPAGDPHGVGPGKRVTFTYSDGEGLAVKKGLELPDSGYVGRVFFEVTRKGAPVQATLIWASGLSEQSDDDTSRYGHVEGSGVVHDGSEVVRLPAATVKEPKIYSDANGSHVKWAGLESTYFASLILPWGDGDDVAGAPFEPAITLVPRPVTAAPVEGKAAAVPLVSVGLMGSGPTSSRLFVGPKDYQLLQSIGHELERVIDFSRISLIYACTKALFLALTKINSYVGNYGWSIIILTVLVRMAFFPIMYRSSIKMRQMSKKMAKIQPRVKAIQERYRKMKKSMETQRKMNEEVMAVYSKEGINPMGNLGGCLPLLLQMPIFIGFYNLLAVTIEMRQAPFILWIHDLSSRDPYYISPILMGASWLLQQWMTSSSIPDPTQRRMMMLMPVMFTFFMMNMPSGLVVYWLTSNVLGMAQQYLTNKKADQLDEAEHARKSPSSKQQRDEDEPVEPHGSGNGAGVLETQEVRPTRRGGTRSGSARGQAPEGRG